MVLLRSRSLPDVEVRDRAGGASEGPQWNVAPLWGLLYQPASQFSLLYRVPPRFAGAPVGGGGARAVRGGDQPLDRRRAVGHHRP